jgi:ABC-type uncharacterized transport system substrate-binding protein
MQKCFLTFSLLVLSCPVDVLAHPHLFIKPSITVLNKGSAISGLRVVWNWDTYWSEDVIAECDFNNDGKFTGDELKRVYDDFFVNIKDFDFFTSLRINGKRQRVRAVSDFTARINTDKTVSYEFTIRLNGIKAGPAQIAIAFNDETIYAAFDNKIPVSASGIIKGQKTGIESHYGVTTSFTWQPKP